MNILAIRHIHFEDLGTWESVLAAQQHRICYIEAPLADFAALDAEADDLVVVLGAPIGAYDEAAYPFLQHELDFVQRRLNSGKPLLGVCLGAQIIARLLGAKVAPMGVKEIGFAPIRAAADSPLAALDGETVLHWHGDRFEIPSAATRIAGSEVCDNQAFQVRRNVLGLQFHLEADPKRIESWLVGHAGELAQAGIAPSQIRADAARFGERLTQLSQTVLQNWIQNWQ